MSAIFKPMSQHSAFEASRAPDTFSQLAELSYLKPSNSRPVSYSYEPPPGVEWESGEYEAKRVKIVDYRSIPTQSSIELQGFELWDAPTQVKDLSNNDEIISTYYRESVELALAVTGARNAYIFDHLVRKVAADTATLNFGRRRADGSATANGRIHNDYTEASGRLRLARVITDSAQADRVQRYSIVNIWRSIRSPVLDRPLALCDARTLSAKDLIVCDVKYPTRTGEIYLVAHSEAHRWSYFSKMERHEALVFKQYDSQLNGTTRFTPHAAFDHPNTPQDAAPRESIELRCLVTY